MIKLTDQEIQLAARLNCQQAALELIKNACEVEFFEISDNFAYSHRFWPANRINLAGEAHGFWPPSRI